MSMHFNDIIYGEFNLPEWLVPFIKIPEVARLRGVRLSNVDSVEFKDFSGPNRWEHSIGVAYLALRYSEMKGLRFADKLHLCIAALMHDVATPPFAHTIENVLEDFNHELVAMELLTTPKSEFHSQGFPVFASQLPQFMKTAKKVSAEVGVTIESERIARLIIGEGDMGYLICGTLDLDNADNVVRACLHMGMSPPKSIPLDITRWIANSEGPVVNLDVIQSDTVDSWLYYRNKMYRSFYHSSDFEIGRQAFLQSILRKALRSGLPRFKLIYNTDERLLYDIENMELNGETGNLKELVDRYRLLGDLTKIAEVDIHNEKHLSKISHPNAIEWIENKLRSEFFEPLVIVNKRRYNNKKSASGLFGASDGVVKVFTIGSKVNRDQLPSWLSNALDQSNAGGNLTERLSAEIANKVRHWLSEEPWKNMDRSRQDNIVHNLEGVGSWGFRLSRNDSIHPYPSTFVHAIPSTLLNAFGVTSELVFDPFGGTGQTAVEAIRYGASAVSADNNSVATLVARTRLSFLSRDERNSLKALSVADIEDAPSVEPPSYDYFEDWHHKETISELCSLKGFIKTVENENLERFLLTCFSAILPKSTARRGKQHGYFADNTPLGNSIEAPPYQPAIDLFLERVDQNLRILENYYSSLKKDNRSPSRSLLKARVIRADIMNAQPSDYGLSEDSVDIIITSPPYLCMSDYTLGKRLTYYWMFDDDFDENFKKEMGARRKRNNPKEAFDEYMDGLSSFCRLVSNVLKPSGILGLVFASPHAKAFESKDIVPRVDDIMKSEGLQKIWSHNRPINWHRNHGYKRLEEERVSVHRL